MTQLFTPNFQRSDANGNPYSGAKLYFYQSGTTTPITVYQDAAKATPHTNPVVADSSGAFAEIFVDTDPYKVVLNTSAGVLIESIDAIPLLAGASIVGGDLTALEALSGTGIAARTTTNTWALRTITGGTGMTVTNGAGTAGDPTVAADIASSANIWGNTADKLLDTDGIVTATAEVSLTDAATITVDMSTFVNAKVTLGGNRTLGNPSNTIAQRSGIIRITQDATGSRTLAYGTNWEFAGGTAPVLSTAANSDDLLTYYVISSTRIAAALTKAYS